MSETFENIDRRESRRNRDFGDSVCIHTDQVYDSCRNKDCMRDLTVYFTEKGQDIIEDAASVKIKKAEVIWVYPEVEPIPFNSGYYTVDISFYFLVTVDAFTGDPNPVEVKGIAGYGKKVILFGSEGNAKIFASNFDPSTSVDNVWRKNNLPTAVVETVDPIALSARISPIPPEEAVTVLTVPDSIRDVLGSTIVAPAKKYVLVTLGLFAIVKIERNVQLLIDAIDFCIPDKTCPDHVDEEPCALFGKITFPLDEFFPPQRTNFPDYEQKVCEDNNCCHHHRHGFDINSN